MALTPLSPDLAWLLTDLEQLSQVPRFQAAELTLPCLGWGILLVGSPPGRVLREDRSISQELSADCPLIHLSGGGGWGGWGPRP